MQQEIKSQAVEHTQRNWHAHNGEGAGGWGGWVVAPLHPSGDGSHYAPITQRISEQDARLIAAAPDLLVALKLAREYVVASHGVLKHAMGPDNLVKPDLDLIDSAISKAQGL